MTATGPKLVWSVVEGVLSPSAMVVSGEPPCTLISGAGMGAGPNVKSSYPAFGWLNLSNLTDFAVPQKLTVSTYPGPPTYSAVVNCAPVPSNPSKTRIRNPIRTLPYALKLVLKPDGKLMVGFELSDSALLVATPGLKVMP